MTETGYEIIEAGKPKAPPRSLILIKKHNRIASAKAFGPEYFSNNAKEMQKLYSHPETGEEITFRAPTTRESILVASCDFANRAKPQIFDPRWLQAGWIVRTNEGVFANPPKDEQGDPITNEAILKQYLNGISPIKTGKGQVYLVENSENLRDFGFADYASFERGVQEQDVFLEGGLARILEHAPKTKILKLIACKTNYPRGVNVYAFEPTKESILKVAGLDSDRGAGSGRLDVVGDYWYDVDGGCAFGVLDDREAAAQKN
ncbi:MAG: hypothetical protein AABW79_04575 [Nanoarchaeota archaeon]